MTAERSAQPFDRVVESIRRNSALDAPARTLTSLVWRFLDPGALKDALSGTWIGHPAHPLLTDVPIGLWTGAVFLDAFGGRRSRIASRRLVGAGVLAAVPTAVTGLSDLADVENKEVRRIGLVHAAANSAAVALFALSYTRRGSGKGRLLACLGLGSLTVGGFLGGHLSYRLGIGVSRNAFEPVIDEWTPTVPSAELPEDEPKRVTLDRNEIMLVRRGGRVYALANRCTHRGGPLYKGRIERDCVVCPWHLSTFALSDGAIVRGPATAPQTTYETRVTDGMIEVRTHR